MDMGEEETPGRVHKSQRDPNVWLGPLIQSPVILHHDDHDTLKPRHLPPSPKGAEPHCNLDED